MGQVCAYLNRGLSPRYLDAGGICVLNQKCVRDHRVDFGLSRRHDVGVKTVSPERLVRIGDVLVNSTGTGTLGRVAQLRHELPEPTTVDSHITIVRPNSDVFVPEFFGYMLISIEAQIQSGGEGCGGQTELARAVLADRFRVRFPVSKNEQRRIVAILDEAFEGIAKARANAEMNVENAKVAFESHLDQMLSFQSQRYGDAPLATFATNITDGDHMPPPKAETGIPFVTIGNVDKKTRRLDFSDTFKVSRSCCRPLISGQGLPWFLGRDELAG